MIPPDYTVLIVILAVGAIVVWRLGIKTVVVRDWEIGLLYRDGRFVQSLAPGRHRYFDLTGRRTIEHMVTGERQTRFGQMDVVSSDRFAFRLHLMLRYRVRDARAAHEAIQAGGGFGELPGLYEIVAAAALAETGARALDDVLADPAAVADAVALRVAPNLQAIEIVDVILSKIELPPETRRMLTETERARRSGLAALERARGEQAALRSLANAARIVRDNPELANLRLLQTIESSKGPTTIVVGDPRTAPLTTS